MRKVFSALCIFFILPVICQTNTKSSATKIIDWQQGQVRKYDIIESVGMVWRSDTLQIENISYKVEIKIISANEDSFMIEWCYKDVDVHVIDFPAIGEMAKSTKGLVLRIRTDRNGEFQKLENQHNVKRYYEDALRTIQNDKHILLNDYIIERIKKKYIDRGITDQYLLEDFRQFYQNYGATLKTGVTLAEHIKKGNSVSEQICATTIEGSYTNEGLLKIDYRQIVDSLLAKQLIMDEWRLYISEYEIPYLKFISLKYNNHMIIQDDGWPSSVDYMRNFGIEDIAKIEIRKITLSSE